MFQAIHALAPLFQGRAGNIYNLKYFFSEYGNTIKIRIEILQMLLHSQVVKQKIKVANVMWL